MLKPPALAVSLLLSTIAPITGALLPRMATPLVSMVLTPAHAASALAPSLQGKPVVVEIYASWCGSCQTIKPVLKRLRAREGNSIHWVHFDVSNSAAAQQSSTRAEALGLGEFFRKRRSQPSLVSVINPATGAAIQTFRAQTDLNSYLKAIQTTRAMATNHQTSHE